MLVASSAPKDCNYEAWLAVFSAIVIAKTLMKGILYCLSGGVRPVSATKSQKKPTKPSAGISISANDREGKKPVVAKGIAQSQLILVKKPKNSMSCD